MRPRVGVDVGGTKVLGVLLDGVAVRARVRLASLPGAAGVVDQVVAAVRELCAAAGVSPADLGVVGLGVPGVVDPEAGTVTHAVNLGLIDPVDLGGAVAEQLRVPVRVENDLNAAALGAAALLGLPARDLAFLALGTGLAAGLLLDGRLRRGASGAAGEIGHVPYRQDGPRCACGQRGCLEVYASGRALEAAWAARPAAAAAREVGPDPARVVAAAHAGEPWAVEAYATFVDAVAAAVRVLVLTCDIEHVVLGGGVAGLGDALLEPVRAALAAQSAGSPFLASLRIADRVQLVPPGSDPAAVGAALAARDAEILEVPWRS
jgi:predicted NBD/HSP70 family sugar kinase